MSYCYGPTYRQIKDEKLNLPCKYNTSFLDRHCGFGEPVVDPNILTFSSFTAYQEPTKIQYMLTGLSEEGRQEAFPDPFLHLILIRQIFRLKIGVGNAHSLL